MGLQGSANVVIGLKQALCQFPERVKERQRKQWGNPVIIRPEYLKRNKMLQLPKLYTKQQNLINPAFDQGLIYGHVNHLYAKFSHFLCIFISIKALFSSKM